MAVGECDIQQVWGFHDDSNEPQAAGLTFKICFDFGSHYTSCTVRTLMPDDLLKKIDGCWSLGQ